MSIISANVFACEVALTEKNDILSAVKILSAYTFPKHQTHADFYTISTVSSTPGDYLEHIMSVRMLTPSGTQVAFGSDYRFSYGYHVDSSGYGSFSLITRFTLELAKLPPDLGWFLIWVYVDDEAVAKTAFMLRRLR